MGWKEGFAGYFLNKVPVPKAQTEILTIPHRANDVSSQRPSCRSNPTLLQLLRIAAALSLKLGPVVSRAQKEWKGQKRPKP
jgi:hypothetical protein